MGIVPAEPVVAHFQNSCMGQGLLLVPHFFSQIPEAEFFGAPQDLSVRRKLSVHLDSPNF
jgi:hypothetical protein